MGFAHRSLTLPRMNAHRLVIIATALTTAVTAALAVALATFSGQALPRAVRHDLGQATGTTLSLAGSVNAAEAAQYAAVLPSQISSALGGTARCRRMHSIYHVARIHHENGAAEAGETVRARRHYPQAGPPWQTRDGVRCRP